MTLSAETLPITPNSLWNKRSLGRKTDLSSKLWGQLAIASAFDEAGLVSSDSPVIARCFTKQKAQPCGLG